MRWSNITLDPALRRLRQFAAAGAVAALLSGAWLLWKQQSATAAVLTFAGIVIGLLGAVRPRWLRWPYVFLSVATFPIGWVVSHVLLAVIYFGLIAPLGLLLRTFGCRPLDLAPRADDSTYWQPRPPDLPPKSYLRQF
jgi:hypothetical protein